MTAARLCCRTDQRETIERLTQEINTLKAENDSLRKEIAELEERGGSWMKT